MTSSLVPIGTFCYGSLSAIFVFWAFLVGPTTLFSHLHCCMYWSIERDRFRYFVRGGFIHSFSNWTLVTRTRSSSVDFLFIYFPVFPSASKSAVVLRWRGVCIGSLALCCRLQSLKTSSDGDQVSFVPNDVTIQTLSVPSLSSTSHQSRTVIDNMTWPPSSGYLVSTLYGCLDSCYAIKVI